MTKSLFTFRPTQMLRQPMGKLLLLLMCSFFFGNNLFAQTTWNGSVSTDWNNAANWSAGVPTTTTDATIVNATNQPTISAAGAVAKSVTVNSSAELTIAAAGALSINGSATQGILNNGTVSNSGTLTIGSHANVGLYGIYNNATFQNNTGGSIHIDNATQRGINNQSGIFTNGATITIGATTSVGEFSIYNLAVFDILCGASLRIVSNSYIYNVHQFNNEGLIVENASSNSRISSNTGLIQNLNGGSFTIDSGNMALTVAGVIWSGGPPVGNALQLDD